MANRGLSDSAGRRRVRDSRGDARSRERARQTRRRRPTATQADASESATQTDAPDSVTQTGEHELDTVGADEQSTRKRPRRISNARRRPDGSRSAALVSRVRHVDAKRAVVLALVISIVALTLAMPMRTYFAQRSELRQLTAANVEKERELADYRQKVNEQEDPAYIEAKARSELLFVKPGETPLVMMYPGDEQRRAAAAAAEKRARAPWYGRLWDSVATPPGVR
ncbi:MULTISPECIES: septum formation initiator family protein [unclassified Gordonia (in: high G+C Gram-positive bacteria)]|uniref:FtsB family cell division protein n=1 Tax=unclassified Gordonia (in: high G+C Gram-positive bacteria) TaxID=2657482 RepID=UPI001F0F797D|nr:septum formation initiator family protein [Gordonia sp. ABSL49_1]MCH5642033.1 septum formation initiator family protein [Gordonia sp. ABSL49_1]